MNLELPQLDAQCGLVVDLDDEILGLPSRDRLRAIARALSLLHGALDGAVLLLSGLTIQELDGIFAPERLPMLASTGWERRWRHGAEIEVDPPPSGLDELHQRALGLLAGRSGMLLQRTACGLSCSAAPEVVGECDLLLHRCVAGRQGFRVLSRGYRYQVLPSNLRKDHMIDRLRAHPRFQGRRVVHIADNVLAEDASRMVRRLRGAVVRVGSSPSIAEYRAQDWSQVLSWMLSQVAVLGAVHSHVDGF